MKKTIYYILFAIVVITIFSCRKDKTQQPSASAALQLLTQKPWKLLSYGYDYNGDGQVNNEEEDIKDCEKDNVSGFRKDGAGWVMENEMICSGAAKISQFTWSFKNDNNLLDFVNDTAIITTLTKDELVITDTGKDPVRMIVVYGH